MREMAAHNLFNHGAGIALATCNHSGVMRGVAAHSLSNHGAGVALATCNHGGVT